MKKVVDIIMTVWFGLLAILAMSLFFGPLPAFGQDGDPRWQWNPIKRALCIGLTDDACDKVKWPDEYNALLNLVGDSNDETTSDVGMQLTQLSVKGGDPRALACYHIQTKQNFGQLCNYGYNYPSPTYAGYTKLRADGKGLLLGCWTPNCIFRFVGEGDDVFFVNKHGPGSLTAPTSGRGVFAMGWSQPPGKVPENEVYIYTQVINGVARIVAKHSDDSTVCITCPGGE